MQGKYLFLCDFEILFTALNYEMGCNGMELSTADKAQSILAADWKADVWMLYVLHNEAKTWKIWYSHQKKKTGILEKHDTSKIAPSVFLSVECLILCVKNKQVKIGWRNWPRAPASIHHQSVISN